MLLMRADGRCVDTTERCGIDLEQLLHIQLSRFRDFKVGLAAWMYALRLSTCDSIRFLTRVLV